MFNTSGEIYPVLIWLIRKVSACSQISPSQRPRDFISKHESKPWSRQKCSRAIYLAFNDFPFSNPFVTGWIKATRTHGICNCASLRVAAPSPDKGKTERGEGAATRRLQMCKLDNYLFLLYCLSQRKRIPRNPKHKRCMKRFESDESRVPLGIGIIFIQDGRRIHLVLWWFIIFSNGYPHIQAVENTLSEMCGSENCLW